MAKDFAMVFWRSHDHYGIGEDGNEYGETGGSDARQREADRRHWRVAAWCRPRMRLLVAVVDGKVARIWPVEPEGEWQESKGRPGAVAIPVGRHPLGAEEVWARYPGLGRVPGDSWPAERGRLRTYVDL